MSVFMAAFYITVAARGGSFRSQFASSNRGKNVDFYYADFRVSQIDSLGTARLAS